MKRGIIIFMMGMLVSFGCSHKPEEVHGVIGKPIKVEGGFKKAFPNVKAEDIRYKLEVSVKEAQLTKSIEKGFRKGYVARQDSQFLLLKVSWKNLLNRSFEIESVFDNFTILSDKQDVVHNWKQSIHAVGALQGNNVLKLSPVLSPKKFAQYWLIFMVPEDVLEDELYLQYDRNLSPDESQLIFRIKIKNSGSVDESQKKHLNLQWS